MAYMRSDTDLALSCVEDVGPYAGHACPGRSPCKNDMVRDLSDLVRGDGRGPRTGGRP